MKHTGALLFGMMILAGLAIGAWAHPPSAYVYLAVQTPPGGDITVDGDLSDWWWFPELGTITTENSFVHAGPDIFDPEDFAWTLRVAWDGEENKIYIAYEIFDDILFPYATAGERETYLYDNFEVIIDADHSGGVYQGRELPEEENGTQAQLWMFPLGGPAEGYHFVYLHGGATWYDQSPYSDYAYRYLGENRHAGEISISLFDYAAPEGPEQSQVHEPEVNQVIGLACLYSDHDEEGTTIDGQWKTHESGQGYYDANVLSDFILIEAPEVDAVVEPETWARIKRWITR